MTPDLWKVSSYFNEFDILPDNWMTKWQICSLDFKESNEVPYFTKFISSLLQSFKLNNEFLDERGSFIIR